MIPTSRKKIVWGHFIFGFRCRDEWLLFWFWPLGQRLPYGFVNLDEGFFSVLVLMTKASPFWSLGQNLKSDAGFDDLVKGLLYGL